MIASHFFPSTNHFRLSLVFLGLRALGAVYFVLLGLYSVDTPPMSETARSSNYEALYMICLLACLSIFRQIESCLCHLESSPQPSFDWLPAFSSTSLKNGACTHHSSILQSNHCQKKTLNQPCTSQIPPPSSPRKRSQISYIHLLPYNHGPTQHTNASSPAFPHLVGLPDVQTAQKPSNVVLPVDMTLKRASQSKPQRSCNRSIQTRARASHRSIFVHAPAP